MMHLRSWCQLPTIHLARQLCHALCRQVCCRRCLVEHTNVVDLLLFSRILLLHSPFRIWVVEIVVGQVDPGMVDSQFGSQHESIGYEVAV